MALRAPEQDKYIDESYFFNSLESKIIIEQMKNILPKNKESRILEIGFGKGSFISACIQIGYKNIYGLDFHNTSLSKIFPKNSSIQELYNIDNTIWESLNEIDEKFDFIYLSHVIEHIPKYHLLEAVDSIFNSLNYNGMLFIRCPNMISYASNSGLYCTLGHEYGFIHNNLKSLLNICGFDNIESYQFGAYGLKGKIGNYLRKPFILLKKIQNRLFGVHEGNNYDSELIMSGTKIKDFDLKNTN